MRANSSLEERLRSALTKSDFAEVRRLLPLYREQIEESLREKPGLDGKREALESLGDLLSLARVIRAHLAAHLAQAQRQATYLPFYPTGERHSWRFEG